METARIKYLGDLRTESTHLKSGEKLITDAPTDNNGKGEAFSPTDLVASSYVSCMLTIIGIYCNKNGLSFDHGEATVLKTMAAGPRRIEQLDIEFDLSGNDWNEDERKRVIEAAEACPVAKSVSEAMKINTNYTF